MTSFSTSIDARHCALIFTEPRSWRQERSRDLAFLLGVLIWLAALPWSFAQLSPAQLEILPSPDAKGWIRLKSLAQSNSLLLLESSPNLRDWSWFATLHDAAFEYPDAESKTLSVRFYRGLTRPRLATDDWKNQIVLPSDEFRSANVDSVRWIKFAVLTAEPTRIFYQNSTKFPFHYDYASQRLAPFIGMGRAAFDQVSLHPANQQVILGAVLLPPANTTNEYGIQLIGSEAYPSATVARMLELVRETIHAPAGGQPFYIPTWEQLDSASANEEFFSDSGFPVSSTARWSGGSSIYAAGWALGRLVYIPAGEIKAAYTDGRLLPADILLTDGVPAEVPLVAGIISLRPSTPNSHVAILSRSFGIPFLHLVDAAERARVQLLAGHEIAFIADRVSGRDKIKVLDVQGALSSEVRDSIQALKVPPLLNFPPKTSYGTVSAPVDDLVPADAKYFGGKAANFGLLRRTIPNSSPQAIAFSFDLWDQFMAETLPSGKALRVEIADRLAPIRTYPPDMPSLLTTLAGIRNLITTTARFSSAQEAAILGALTGFDPSQRIRFRSSTNMEDAEQFTGAGLYDSYSGCLLDDLDADTSGPCGCDSGEANEKGVFRAIQKVYASFYNDNAYLERLRHQVDESQVGMAFLVHHSYPDEQANGVATMDATIRTSIATYAADLVTQLGEVSVANPEGDALPELIKASQFGANPSFSLVTHSSLVPLGAYVMNWDADYRALMSLLVNVTNAYRQMNPTRTRFLLDYEYKKEGGAMLVKQVRPLPVPKTSGTVIPFLMDEPADYVVFQGEYSDVFANHRLKSEWSLSTRNLRLTDTALQTSFYAESKLNFVRDATIVRLTGPLNGWPAAAYSIAGNVANDSWTTGTGIDQRIYHLETNVIRQVTEGQQPLLTNADFTKLFSVNYSTPVAKLTQSGVVTTATEERVRLVPKPVRTPGSLLQTRTFSNSSGLNVQTSFYWPENPQLAAGYTAPLVEWVETFIQGLTAEPLVLRGYYSQTYRPEHHNFGESFIFEPRLEDGIPPEALTQLAAADIQFLCCIRRVAGSGEIWAMGNSGLLRRLN